MSAASHRLQVGRFDCLIVKDGTAGHPRLSDYMNPVPGELASYEMFMEGGLMLVEVAEKRILIDAGNGPTRGPRTHAAEAVLETEEIPPESIDTILLTHGDPDHIMGLLTRAGDPVYANASYVLHRDLWDAWKAPPSAGLYFAEQEAFVHRLAVVVADRCRLFAREEEILPGIRAIPALGHRAGHTAYLFESSGEKLLHIGDAAFDPIFLEYAGIPNVRDTQPERAQASRRMLVERAIAEDAMVVGSHFRLPGVGRLAKIAEDRYRWSPATT
jgi:glyoxylase-like metal-dependent hydrolase (beta-lactamase superfamily II)